MRRALALVLTTALLLLCACTGERDEERFETWRQTALSGELRFTAEITAIGPDRETVYGAECRYADGSTELRLTDPALIAGIAVRSGPAGGELRFDGAILSLGSVTKSGLSPCAAVPRLMEALERGHALSFERSGGRLTAELALSERETARLCLDEAAMTPESAELTEEGRTAVYIRFSAWRIGETDNGKTENEDLGGDLSARAGA